MVNLPDAPTLTAAAPPSEEEVLPEIEVYFGGGTGHMLQNFKLVMLELRLAVNEIPSGKARFKSVLDMHDDYALLSQDLLACGVGTDVTVQVKGKVLFAGLVASLGFEVRQGAKELTLKLKHPLQRLVATHRSQVFAKQSDQHIIERLFNTHDIPVKIQQGLSVQHEQMVQCACSDWDFVRIRLAANGVWLLPIDKSVTITLPKLAGAAQHTLLAISTNKSALIEEAAWAFTGLTQPSSIKLSNWDVSQQKMLPAKQAKAALLGSGALDPLKLPALDPLVWEVWHSVPLEAAEQTALVNSRLTAQHATGIQGRFAIKGRSDIELGQTLNIKGFGKALDGTGIVTGVEHRFDVRDRRWRMTLYLGLDSIRQVEVPMVPKIRGLYIGVVDSFEQDNKMHWNRIRVRIPTLGLDEPLWARLTSPYASKESGFCFYPEAGDEVVLGFFEDDPRYPVVMGAMHNPKKPAPFAPSRDNAVKGVVLVQGAQKQEWIFDRKEHSITANLGDDKVVLHKGLQIQSDGGDALVKTKHNLTLTAEQTQTLKAGTDWHAQAERSAKLNSGATELALVPQKAQLNAAEIDAQGSATVKLGSGPSKLELTTARAKISALNTEVQGSLGVKVKSLKIDLGP